MINTVLEYLLAHFPEIGIGFLFVFACIYVTWKVRGIYDQSHDIREKVTNLPCQAHSQEIDRIKQNGNKLDDISSSIRKIEEWIIKQDVDAMEDLVRKCSPYKLTDLGLILLWKSGAVGCIDDNMDFFMEKMEETRPLTAYDVERNALSVVTENLGNPIYNQIKDYVYNSPRMVEMKTENGEQEVKVDMRRVLMVMSIYLRDKYFERHVELDTSDFPKTNVSS